MDTTAPMDSTTSRNGSAAAGLHSGTATFVDDRWLAERLKMKAATIRSHSRCLLPISPLGACAATHLPSGTGGLGPARV